jgi:diguanylate cyclase (GGDEF)-like protein
MKKVVRNSIWIPDDPALRRAQLTAFTKQVPLLYFILSVNAGALAFAFCESAPPMLTSGVSGGLISLCVVRLIVWTRSIGQELSDAAIARRLKATIFLGAAIGIAFLAWALALFPYGNDRAQGQVTFFVGITVVSCIFCLMHLRPAALLLAVTIVVPFTAFLVTTGDTNLASIGINLFLVSLAMVYVLMVASRDFGRLVSSKAEAKRLSDENARLANVDALTSLPNRRQFFSEVSRAVDLSHADAARWCAVGVIDLDGFKQVNDRLGHLAGDELLRQAGERLLVIADSSTFIARLGGDEFGVVVQDPPTEAGLLELGDRFCTMLNGPYELAAGTANVSASIGFAAFSGAANLPSVLYERADYALYHAKAHHRGRAVVFSAEHEAEIRTNSIIEDCLRGADFDAEMSLEFQPIYDIARNRIIAFEALPRWSSPELGEVSPAVFIPLAEQTGLISTLNHHLFQRALAAAMEWPAEIRVFFNLSARDVVSPEAILRILTTVRNGPVSPSRIGLEIKETSIVADFDQARQSLAVLKSLGVEIALDDFGMGYASLSHVHRLPLDRIKVDGSFIRDIETGGASQTLIESIIDLCKNLSISCVIDGAENARQVEIVKGLGCTGLQGSFFGGPISQEQVLRLLAARDPYWQHRDRSMSRG